MDKEILDAISDLSNRTSQLESIHPNLTYTKEGLIHNIYNHLPLIIAVTLLSTVTVLIVLKYKKSN